VTFLRRVSPLDELSGPLCDAVLGMHGSGTVLRNLSRSTFPVSALDRSEEHFRCNVLLAEALRAELHRLEPDREVEIHRRASTWYDAHGDVERAIEHAIATGDPEYAGRLIWRAAPGYAAKGQIATVDRWLQHFTDAQISRHPELALAVATVHMVRGDRDLVERWALIADAVLEDAPHRTCAGLEAGVAIMRATVARNGTAQMREDAARGYVLEPEESPWRALCCLLMGAGELFEGNSAEGRRRLEEGSSRGSIAAPSIGVKCRSMLALAAFMDERWEEGARLASLARAEVERVGLGEYPTSALVFAVSALEFAHRGRGNDARREARDARRLLAALRDFTPFLEVATAFALARAELRLGDAVAARTLLAECERIAKGMPDAVVLRTWLDDSWAGADAFAQDDVAGSSALTTAELRVLNLLPTHLTLGAIAVELFVSRHTVKAQAQAVYRKLDASSRAEAVARATQLGLLGP
jgi:LuxR family maltose regulon positive regulatory protein